MSSLLADLPTRIRVLAFWLRLASALSANVDTRILVLKQQQQHKRQGGPRGS
jgi:hypothetical protein